MSKVSKKAQKAVYEAVVDWFVEFTHEPKDYVEKNCWLMPNFEWGYKPYDAINSEGIHYGWTNEVCQNAKVQAVAKKHGVFIEPYTGWSLGLYKAYEA